ncbi:MAG: sulfatase [Verrucomicrobia bacterium]|nr:sulfatase [Verrucomicrobiota bacterium]
MPTPFRLALLAAVAIPAALAAATPRPNFIVINIDDLGYSDIAAWGSANRTPHLDRMVTEGRRLLSHYAAPVCSPSRASLLTGCYPKRVLPIPHVLFPGAAVGLHPDEATIADVLKGAGYATGCIGKWHVGDQRPFLPLQQGFDTYFGLPYSNDMGPASEGVKSSYGAPLPKAKTPAKKVAATDDETGIRGQQPPLPLLDGNTVVRRVRAEDQLELARLYTEHAVTFIRERRDRPFFLYLAHNAVHFPHYPRAEFRGQSAQGLLGDWISEVDWSVGRVLDTLRELQIDRRTLVFFVSDNGGPVNQGATNRPLRGSKGSTLEGGIRVPAIAWWPGQIPPGTSTTAITSMMDVLPTLAQLAGAALPSRKLDGVNVWPALAGDPATPPRDSFLYFRGLALEAVRSGPWKLHLAKGELYHLGDDLGEARNVAAAQPEVVRRLIALAESTAADLGRDGVGPGCRPLGRVDRPLPLITLEGTVRADAAGKHARLP